MSLGQHAKVRAPGVAAAACELASAIEGVEAASALEGVETAGGAFHTPHAAASCLGKALRVCVWLVHMQGSPTTKPSTGGPPCTPALLAKSSPTLAGVPGPLLWLPEAVPNLQGCT